jgi:hypothetical protein
MKRGIGLLAALLVFVGTAGAADVYYDEGAFTAMLLPGYCSGSP